MYVALTAELAAVRVEQLESQPGGHCSALQRALR